MGYYGVGMTPASGAGGSSSNGSSSNDTKKTNSAPIYSGTGSSGAGSGDDTIWTTEDYNNVGSSNSSGPSNQEVFNSKTMSELDSLMYRWGDPYDGNVTAEEIMRYGVLGAYDKSAEGSPLNDDSSTGSSGGLGLTRRTMGVRWQYPACL